MTINQRICGDLNKEISAIQKKIERELGVSIPFSKASQLYVNGNKFGGTYIITKARRGIKITRQ